MGERGSVQIGRAGETAGEDEHIDPLTGGEQLLKGGRLNPGVLNLNGGKLIRRAGRGGLRTESMGNIDRLPPMANALFGKRGDDRRLDRRLFRRNGGGRRDRNGRTEARRKSAGTKGLDMLLLRGKMLAGRGRILPGRTGAGGLRRLIGGTGVEPRPVRIMPGSLILRLGQAILLRRTFRLRRASLRRRRFLFRRTILFRREEKASSMPGM